MRHQPIDQQMHECVGRVSLLFILYMLHNSMNCVFDQETSPQIGINCLIGQSLDNGAEQTQHIRFITDRLLDLLSQSVDSWKGSIGHRATIMRMR